MAAGAALWRAILDPRRSPPPAPDRALLTDDDGAATRRLGTLVGPALAGWLLGRAAAPDAPPLVDLDAVRHSRLFNRLNGGVQRRWVSEIAATGTPVVVMKGFALAHTVYPDPDIRTVGDLDVLVRSRDRDRLLSFLESRGFAFETLPSSAWGFISDASYQPMVSDDGACSIDVHVQPDCYPAHRSLTAERVFAAARPLEVGGAVLAVPSPAHALVLCLTNAAKDKFGPLSVRKLVDIAAILGSGEAIDWQEVSRLARDGHFAGPARVVFALLVRLGLPADGIPMSFRAPPAGLRAGLFEKLVRDYEDLFAEEPRPFRVLARELALCTEPDVAAHNALLRLRGLVSPRRGIPAGYRSRW